MVILNLIFNNDYNFFNHPNSWNNGGYNEFLIKHLRTLNRSMDIIADHGYD